VPQAQWEAADCLALTSFDTLRASSSFPQAVQIATAADHRVLRRKL